MGSGAGPLLAQTAKEAIKERLLDFSALYKHDSMRKGKKARLKGFLDMLGGVGVDYLLSNFSSIVMGSVMVLYNFNFNQTDKQIEEAIEQNNVAMVGQGGRLAASGLVRFAAIGVTKKALHKYPKIDPSALLAVQEDQREEFTSGLQSVLTSMRSSVQNSMFLSTYMSFRKLFGKSPDKPGEPWIISEKIEDSTEKIQDKYLKSFLTQFREEAEDAIMDVGYLLTSGVQTSYLMAKEAKKQNAALEKVVKYTPDESEPGNFTFLVGDSDSIIETVQTARAVAVTVEKKDIGEAVMIELPRAIRTEANHRILTAFYRAGVNGASTKPDGKRSTSKMFTISNVKPTVDWQKLKDTLKPVDGGPHKVICKLSDGHQLHGFFVSEAEGKRFLRVIAETLCIGDPVEFTHISPRDNAQLRPDPERFEVSYAKLWVPKQTNDITKKKYVDRAGKMFNSETVRIKLNVDKKPEGIDEKMLNPFADPK
jgi:hypothetical protein